MVIDIGLGMKNYGLMSAAEIERGLKSLDVRTDHELD
jgi:hypothetical protein